MKTKIQKGIIVGIISTIIFSAFTMIAPMMGFPKMSPPAMLSMMMGLPIVVGWVMHFMIGIVFSLAYTFYFIKLLKKISSNILKGTIFGFAAFIFAQLALGMMGIIFPMPPMEGNMILMLLGSIIGHIVFGISVALQIKAETTTASTK